MPRIEINTNDLATIPAAAEALGRPKITLYRWIEKGKITAIELGGVLFIQVKELERLKTEANEKAAS